jgi:hypothetical protein
MVLGGKQCLDDHAVRMLFFVSTHSIGIFHVVTLRFVSDCALFLCIVGTCADYDLDSNLRDVNQNLQLPIKSKVLYIQFHLFTADVISGAMHVCFHRHNESVL